MEIINIIIATVLSSTGSGWMIFSKELFTSSKPIKIMTIETTKPEIYSNLPCPNGWS